MRPRRWRAARAAAAVGLAAVVLAGCAQVSAEDGPPITGCAGGADGAVVLAISGRAMAGGPDLTGGLLSIVQTAVAAGRPVALVNADGRPEVVRRYPALEVDSGTSGYDAAVLDRTDDIAIDVAELRADSPQMDVLATVDLSVRVGRELSPHPPVIVVVDSLLSTVAPIDFTRPGMLSADPEEVVEHIRATFGLLDLQDSAVLFYGVGNVAQPQEALPPGLRRAVSDIWEAVATASGAACVESREAAGTGRVVDGVPPVDPVPVPQVEPVALSEQPTVLGSDVLRFRPDTAELVDPAEAQRVIDAIAAQLIGDPPMCIELVGTTATGTPGRGPDPVALSEARAHAVEGLLIAAGISHTVLHPRGIGAAPFEGRVPDVDGAGVPIPAASALNRTVRIEQCG